MSIRKLIYSLNLRLRKINFCEVSFGLPLPIQFRTTTLLASHTKFTDNVVPFGHGPFDFLWGMGFFRKKFMTLIFVQKKILPASGVKKY